MKPEMKNSTPCLKCGRSPRKNPGTSTFRFPKPGNSNYVRCELWAKYCFPDAQSSSHEFQLKLFREYKMLCDKHFKRTSFDDYPHGTTKLNKSAVPVPDNEAHSLDEPSITNTDNNCIDEKDQYPYHVPIKQEINETDFYPHFVTVKGEPDTENLNYINEENVGNISVNLKYEIKEEPSTSSSSSDELTQETSTNIDLQQRSIESKTPDFEDEEENINIDKQMLDGKTSEINNKYKCDICDKEFNRSRYLKSHMYRTHATEQPYSCDICDKKFKQRGHLKSHKLIHTGEKPYSCDVCDKKFNIKSNLTKHKRLHTGEKPYSCDICDKKFSRIDALNTHRHTLR